MLSLKGALSGLKRFLTIENPLNVIKTPFISPKKASFVLKGYFRYKTITS